MNNHNSTLKGQDNLKGINLQFFAEDEEGTEPPKEGDNTPKTYTQEELDKLLQQEGDRRVSSARVKFEEEFSEKLEKEKKEAERLATLSAKEKEAELLKQKEKELEDKEKAIQYRELQLDTIKILSDEKMPVAFADFLIKDNAENTQSNITKFKDEWQKALEQAVDERIKGTSPRQSIQDDLGLKGSTDFLTLANEASIR